MGQLKLSKRETDEDELPDLCMSCGEKATTSVRKTFQWSPVRYVGAGPNSGPGLIGSALILATSKFMTFEVPLCDGHKRQWLWPWVVMGVGLTLAFVLGPILMVIVGLGTMAADLKDLTLPLLLVIFGFIFITTLATMIFSAVLKWRTIRADLITDKAITLGNVSDKFIRVMEKRRRARKA
jgi:hypothetical protein